MARTPAFPPARELNAAVGAPGPSDAAYGYHLERDNPRAAVGSALAVRDLDTVLTPTAHAIVHGIIGILDPVRRTEHLQMLRRAAAELDNPLANAWSAHRGQ